MNRQMNQCNTRQIEAFLDDRLSESEQAALIEHLDHCVTCREQIGKLAADPETWSAADSFLTDEALDSVRLDTSELLKTGNRLRATTGPVVDSMDASIEQAAATVLHPNVIAIHSVSSTAELPYLVMPYIRGRSLQKRLDDQGQMELKEVLRVGCQVAAGLAAAHAQGLVHRDIKPANILLEDGVERVTLTDFGLARAVDDATLTRSGVIAGTPLYMSPEQASGEPIDARSDLFSLGSVLYTMCAGRPPFRADTSLAVLRRIADQTPRPLSELSSNIPLWMSRMVERLHAKRPEQRIQSAAEVEQLMQQCLAHLEQPHRTPLPECLREPQRWTWKPAIAIGTLIVGLGIMSLLALALPLSFPEPDPGEATEIVNKESSELSVESANALGVESTWVDGAESELAELEASVLTLEQDIEQD